MNLEILSDLNIRLIKISPILICLIFILFDSVPMYLFEFSSFKTQLGIMSVYSWICCDHKKLRPLLLLILGFLIDIFNGFIFGLSSLAFLFIFLIQRSNFEILLSKNFNSTWIRFIIFIIIYNCFLLTVHKFFLNELSIDILEIAYSIAVMIILFPIMFSLVNYLNEKIKYINE